MTGQYNVTVTDANGCINNGSAFVQVNSIPNPVAAANSPICVKETIVLNANAGGAQVAYTWNGPAGFLSSSPNPQITQASTGMSGQYTITITDNAGCSSSAVVSMVVNDLPNGSISTSSKFGCVPFCASFSVSANTTIQSVTWDMGLGGSMAGTTVNKCYTQDGVFPIKANFTDANGCSNFNTYTVQVYPLPTADFNMGPREPIVNEEVLFTNASYGGNIISTSWNFSHLSPTVTTEYSPMMIFSEAGSYVVALIVQSDKGCKDTLIRPFFIAEDYGIYVPNAFSPNGDGVNDIFHPKGYGVVKYELNIFDRWGEKLFSTTNFEEGWKGNYVGRSDEAVPVGVYTWHIKLINVQGRGKELTGKVSVIR
jgi:gliding motility-associated-like protein